MDETPTGPPEANTTKAVKDKSCPYCHQAFTSSSLGRHLDLYIREKNPKAPDGLHDVDAIRKIRQNITRRQPKGAVARRGTSASVGTPTAASRSRPASGDADSSAARSPPSPKDGPQEAGAASGSTYLYKPRWEDTGVINDLAVRPAGASGDAERDGTGRGGAKSGPSQRSVSRQTLKQQLDMRQQIQDAEDRSRAAELALRELLGSLRAAKHQIDIDSTPFDFDTFSLDFPALTLQCLDPPPTLFASTQHPTPTSWSILPPGQIQFEALHAYFQGEFRRWKTACAAATTALNEELTYPPPSDPVRTDSKAEVLKAEKAAAQMEKHVYDHLAATYSIWNGLAQEQREQLWRLELARGVGRKRKEVDKLKEGQHLLRQENAHLKAQVEQLTRLQQPREFKVTPPSTVYVDEKLVAHMLENAMLNGRPFVGLNMADRNSDLGTVVSSVIDRWKKVIVSTRSAGGGLQAQRTLSTGTTGLSPRASIGEVSPTNQQQSLQLPQQSFLNGQNRPQPRQLSIASAHGTSSPASIASPTTSLTPRIPTTPAVPSAAPSISIHADDDGDEEMSDQDAESDDEAEVGPNPEGDAEGDTDADADADADMMDDNPGGYTGVQLQPLQQLQQRQQQPHSTVPMPLPPQQMGQLEAARTRQQMGGGRRSTTNDGRAGYGGLGQEPVHGRGRMPSWA
ncbi:hypothetical protein C8A01DRAFT_13325 [Parachaetomium inaequale]|uniref:Uncharacterized protein n=1 Tax=Parachaetomium inaequale TaxID=2588326 RepID=A0AAN6SU16_9PEZI|nr:hypothetical protein C8A01DRAFT_13325 [Parachaetomium inaequale]